MKNSCSFVNLVSPGNRISSLLCSFNHSWYACKILLFLFLCVSILSSVCAKTVFVLHELWYKSSFVVGVLVKSMTIFRSRGSDHVRRFVIVWFPVS